MKKNLKKIISMILCSAMILATFMNSSISHAATEDELITQGLVVYELHEDVEDYRVNKTYPDAEAEGDYAFAGWYYQEGTAYKPYSVTGADNATTAYAKFVDADVFGAMFQVTADTTTESLRTDMRIVSSVDSVNYTNVGFKVTFNNKTLLCNTADVYPTINVFVNDNSEPYEPTDVFSDASMYFATHRINGITNDAFDKGFTVQPTWTTLDGTTVEAKADKVRTITVDEMVDEYVVDFEEGVNFENMADLGVIVPYNGSNGFSALWSGNYANASLQTFNNSTQLAITGTNSNAQWPTFYVNFGKTYPAGTVLTFNCYYDSTGNSEGTLHEMVSGQSEPVKAHTISWIGSKTVTELSFTLENACDRIAILTTVTEGSTMYYDDFKVVTPIDFEEGVDFERAADLNAITPYNGSNGFSGLWSGNWANASLQRFNNSTQLAITGTNSTAQWPTFYVNFGKTYPAGTVLTFNCYYDSTGNSEGTLYEMVSGQSEPVKAHTISWIGSKTVTELSFTLENACDRIAIFITVTEGSTMYYDDFKVVTPIDFEEGVDFERAADLNAITPYNGSNGFSGLWSGNWANASLQTFNNSTQLAITGTNSSAQWPTFYVNFGKTYPAGTVLTFNCYYDSTGNSEGTLFEMVSGQSEPVKQHTISWIGSKTVTRLTFTLENACDRIAIFTTVAEGSTMYFDDFKIQVPSN